MLPASLCDFEETFIVETFSELSEQGEQNEDIPLPAGSVPGNGDPISIHGPLFFMGEDCPYIEVSKSQKVELRLMTSPPRQEIKPGTIIEVTGHFLSNQFSYCNVGPVFGASIVKIYGNEEYFPPTGNSP
jgi:hypothetical protein